MKILLFIFIGTVLISCDVEKRLHRPGFYFKKNNRFFSHENTVNINKSNVDISKQYDISNDLVSNENTIPEVIIEPKEEKNSKVDEFFSLPVKKEVLIKKQDACDQIFLKNGTEILAKVLEVNETEVKYKPCNSETPIYTLKTDKIAVIKYATGSVESFINENASNNNENAKVKENRGNEIEILGVVSLILGITAIPILLFLSWLIGAILAFIGLIFGIVGIIRYKNNKSRFKSKAAGVAGLILGIISLGFSVYYIGFVLTYF